MIARSPRTSPTKEVINQPYPERHGEIPMAAGGDKLMTVPGEISWPPLGRST